ncbi:hypothetical protein SDC9_99147 [bioreactor metagenome]|uniref:Uncharacterized protein n=1 Tax=bioreactor metagenome TaxID=1076179 RepID=A0A645AI46_9ZZZZ
MLHRNVFILHALGDGSRGTQRLVHVGGDIDLAALPAANRYLWQLIYLTLCGRLKAFRRQAHTGEQLGDQPVFRGQQRHEQMKLLNLLVAVSLGQGLCALHRFKRLLRKILHIHESFTSCQKRGRRSEIGVPIVTPLFTEWQSCGSRGVQGPPLEA